MDLDFLSARGIKLIEKQQKETYRSFTQSHRPLIDTGGTDEKPKLAELFWYLSQVRKEKKKERKENKEKKKRNKLIRYYEISQ